MHFSTIVASLHPQGPIALIPHIVLLLRQETVSKESHMLSKAFVYLGILEERHPHLLVLYCS